MSSGQNMFTKGQTSELAWVTSSNIPSPLYLFSKILPPVYDELPFEKRPEAKLWL